MYLSRSNQELDGLGFVSSLGSIRLYSDSSIKDHKFRVHFEYNNRSTHSTSSKAMKFFATLTTLIAVAIAAAALEAGLVASLEERSPELEAQPLK
ncbi:hypothetical protein PM082_010290 [Marasmius tenuissimus]|nr:hypothetical protein PM082_010290 [Marasmius tenuissimus]